MWRKKGKRHQRVWQNQEVSKENKKVTESVVDNAKNYERWKKICTKSKKTKKKKKTSQNDRGGNFPVKKKINKNEIRNKSSSSLR